MDKFFSQKHCDHCGGSLESGRTMSRFDTSVLCLMCAEKEKQDKDYDKAVKAELDEIRKGNYNFKGIKG